jgi:hypothetical protein
VSHRRIAAIASAISAYFGHFGVPCGALWLYNEAVHVCSFWMVSDTLLAILAIGTFLCVNYFPRDGCACILPDVSAFVLPVWAAECFRTSAS